MPLPAGQRPGRGRLPGRTLNAGAPTRIVDHLVTPTAMVFVRGHADVSLLAADSHRLRVDGSVQRALELSLDALENRFERIEVVAALCCAGYRRRELMEVADIPQEVPWGVDAVSNVRWSGWRLRDVLAAAVLRARCDTWR